MTLAHFKLESFSAASAGMAEMIFGKAELDQAYADGLAEGLTRREDEQLRNLGAGLERLAQALADDEARRIALRDEAARALAPILDAILDSIAPAADSLRLQGALRDELTRLARLGTPLRARIACGPRLRGLVERCLEEAGLAGIELSEAEADKICLSLQGGRIEISPAQIAQDIRALISELKEDHS
ncbi:hypothetical protein [Paracoccus spongiarum]|uniref:Flagellar assembly protein FliH/Type III secretion system HrpE domain-containing protein n=1 Tax=Paracoccus spongiarum TaxID=3064387 RepID=A0ABT9JFI8_9RHOB|nr:hypothetical protein [Paracoccus sp. 2205BS29-5]MDP5308575.1 hypothetical protein [Paracoccus sp. 2205BS29-5]